MLCKSEEAPSTQRLAPIWCQLENVRGRFKEGDILSVVLPSGKADPSGIEAKVSSTVFLAERSIIQIESRRPRWDVENFANTTLVAGAKFSARMGQAVLQHIDAEWHRSQHWALANEHIGKRVIQEVHVPWSMRREGGTGVTGFLWGGGVGRRWDEASNAHLWRFHERKEEGCASPGR